MSLLDGLRGEWSDDEIRHVANEPVTWLVKARTLQAAADLLCEKALLAIDRHALEQKIATFSAALEAEELAAPISLLYGFALENALKAAYIRTQPNFDFLNSQDRNIIWSHDLRYLYGLCPDAVSFEGWQLNLLDELSVLIQAQGRYPAGKPGKKGDAKLKNAHPLLSREFKEFVTDSLNLISEFIDAPNNARRSSPLGPTVAVASDGVFDPAEHLKAAGMKVFEWPQDEDLKDRFK